MAKSGDEQDGAAPIGADGGTTPYQRMVVAAATQMQSPPDLPQVDDIARIAGIDPAMAADMFPDDTALCSAVAEDAIARLGSFVTGRVAAAPLDDPTEQVRSMLLGYHDWAQAERLGARMLVDHRVPTPCRAVYQRYVTALLELAHAILGRAADQGRLRPPMTVKDAELLGRALIVGVGRIVLGEADDYLRDRDDHVMRADFVNSINAYCDVIFIPAGG